MSCPIYVFIFRTANHILEGSAACWAVACVPLTVTPVTNQGRQSLWYLRRITVRQSRCSTSGTKLKVSSCATRRFTNRSASGKSFLRPPGPRFDCAWARWSVPASRGAPSRVRRRGRPCCSRASQTGRQVLRRRLHDDVLDLALDQPVGQAAQIGRRRPDLLALEVRVAVDLDVGHHDGQHLLVHVNSRDPVRHRSLLGERRACLVASVRVASYPGSHRSPHDAQWFTQSRTLRTAQLLGLNSSTGWFDLGLTSGAK